MLVNAVLWSRKFEIWFRMGFWAFAIQCGILVIAAIGVLLEAKVLIMCG